MKESINTYIKRNFNNLIKLDKERFLKLLGTVQYTILYIIVTLFFAYLIDQVFFNKYEDIEKESKLKILMIVFIQIIVNVICVYYIKKIVQTIPFIFNHPPYGNYNYNIDEFNGEMIFGFIFIGAQFNLLNKINYLVVPR